MAYAEVGAGSQRATSAEGSGGNNTAVFPANVGSGNLLVAGGSIARGGSTSTSLTVTDSLGTSYTVKLSGEDINNSFNRTFIAYGVAASGGANTITVAPSNGLDRVQFAIDEFSGQHATPLDVDGGASGDLNSGSPTMNITTVAANDLILGAICVDTSDGSETDAVGAGYTRIGHLQGLVTAGDDFSFEFQLVTTVGTYAVNWTLSTNYHCQIYCVAMKPVGGPPPSAARFPYNPRLTVV